MNNRHDIPRYDTLPSPIGELWILADADGALHAVCFDEPDIVASGKAKHDPATCRQITEQLSEYFAGKRREFTVPLAAEGTPFQRRVWHELMNIPYGTTTSYGQLAARLGAGTSPRAVGSANGANPIAVIVPCHRVIGADGSLTGYAGGLERKERLLRLEGAIPYQPTLTAQGTLMDAP